MGFSWRPMQAEAGEKGDVLITIWQSKKIPWHWIVLYRFNKLGTKTVPKPILGWDWKGRHYDLVWHR